MSDAARRIRPADADLEPGPGTLGASRSNEALDLDRVNAELAGASAEDIVRWALGHFPGSLLATSSFGAESAVMLHLLHRVGARIPVVFLDTGYLFPETYQFADELQRRFDLDVRVYGPSMTPARMEALHGRLWDGTEAERAKYAQLTKIEPMDRALSELGARAWMAGLRQGQTAHRASLRVVEKIDGVYKVHPILRWSQLAIERYMDAHDLPYHPLVPFGYLSIGDTHSTIPVAQGEDSRSGRQLGASRECGIHLPRNEQEDASLKSSGL
jgi:phosphoadenosine phosphosulfate reductase